MFVTHRGVMLSLMIASPFLRRDLLQFIRVLPLHAGGSRHERRQAEQIKWHDKMAGIGEADPCSFCQQLLFAEEEQQHREDRIDDQRRSRLREVQHACHQLIAEDHNMTRGKHKNDTGQFARPVSTARGKEGNVREGERQLSVEYVQRLVGQFVG